jgi:late competence protein required for DNA uptake (superfamily II DNA/RNA helicase)
VITVESKENKERLFFAGKLMCERCFDKKATWICHYGDYKVYCNECEDITFWEEEEETTGDHS